MLLRSIWRKPHCRMFDYIARPFYKLYCIYLPSGLLWTIPGPM